MLPQVGVRNEQDRQARADQSSDNNTKVLWTFTSTVHSGEQESVSQSREREHMRS